LFIAGIGVSLRGEDVIASCAGFSFYARAADDLNFVDEVLLKNCYNILTPTPACVIDIGMNIGLTSLRLASSPNVREVHAFEPFPTTFGRAAANVALNPEQQGKIAMHNFGMFDSDTEVTVHINSSDSGSYSVFGADRGESVTIQLRDAGATLRPIVEAAEARGLLAVLKVDCEGSEFAVFRSLAASGLIDRVAAYMVEYHRGHGASSELTSRLIEAGFAVIDLGYSGANGFFYAIRLGRDGSAQ
jgi:FkbM family methyltransferase